MKTLLIIGHNSPGVNRTYLTSNAVTSLTTASSTSPHQPSQSNHRQSRSAKLGEDQREPSRRARNVSFGVGGRPGRAPAPVPGGSKQLAAHLDEATPRSQRWSTPTVPRAHARNTRRRRRPVPIAGMKTTERGGRRSGGDTRTAARRARHARQLSPHVSRTDTDRQNAWAHPERRPNNQFPRSGVLPRALARSAPSRRDPAASARGRKGPSARAGWPRPLC
jgi:hypothetical protein